MAIVRTGNTIELASELNNGITDALWAGERIAEAVRNAVEYLSEGANDDSNADGSYSWVTAIGATSASHTETWTDFLEGFGWGYRNGTKKYAFVGSNLDGALTNDPQSATRFTYVRSIEESDNAPGFAYSDASDLRYSAAVGFNLAAPDALAVGNFTVSHETRSSSQGWGGVYNNGEWIGTGVGESKGSIAFVGSANWSLTTGTMTEVAVKSYLSTYRNSGTYTYAPSSGEYSGSTSQLFSLVGSAAGLTATILDDVVTLGGGIASITLKDSWRERIADELGTRNERGEDYYRYVNGAASADDFNLSIFADYHNAYTNMQLAEVSRDLAGEWLSTKESEWLSAEAAKAALDWLDPLYEAYAMAAEQAKETYDAALQAYEEAVIAYDDAQAYYDTGRDADIRAELFKGNDIITVTDVHGGEIYAGAGNDKVIGGKGNDYLSGDDGDDILTGGDGWDEILGGTGKDSIKAGNGDDEVFGDDGDDNIDGGAGNDALNGGAGSDRILGGAGNDRISGDEGNDSIDGGTGDDFINGGDGNDLIKGGAGLDILRGDAGNDTLDGGAGNDILMGGEGVDVLTGGSGIDGFYFAAGDSGDESLSLETLDRITDFNVAQDRLQLFNTQGDYGVVDAYVLTGTETQGQLGKADSYEALLNGAMAVSLAGEHYVVGYDNANTYFFADLDGDGNLDIAIQLVGIKGDEMARALTIEMYSYS